VLFYTFLDKRANGVTQHMSWPWFVAYVFRLKVIQGNHNFESTIIYTNVVRRLQPCHQVVVRCKKQWCAFEEEKSEDGSTIE
jgi:hypothetical protein